jgi:hypothetical protein
VPAGVLTELSATAVAGGWKTEKEPAQANRRSVYVFVKRNLRYPMFETFDFPDTHESCSSRNVTTSPLHRGLPTDRLLVDWQLDTKRVIAAINELVRDPVEGPATIHLPSELEQWKQDDPQRIEAEQTRIREEFLHWFVKGYAVTGVRFTLTGADYCLAPWSDF